MRLDKFLADVGIGSRSQVKILLKKGRITVDGQIEKNGRTQVDEHKQTITFDHQVLSYQAFYYYLLNKPKGVVSATKDNVFKTVVQLLSEKDYRADIFPVGRLDKDTEGLLLLTNDGALGHDLTQPRKHVEKAYLAIINGNVTDMTIKQFAAGLTFKNGETARPGELSVNQVKEANTTTGFQSEVEVIIHEGKFHQVKRMFEAVDMRVLELKRIRMGHLRLDPTLALGEYRQLTAEELTLLKQS